MESQTSREEISYDSSNLSPFRHDEGWRESSGTQPTKLSVETD